MADTGALRELASLPYSKDLKFGCLAAYEHHRLIAEGKTKVHADHPLTVAKVLKDMPPIPTGKSEFFKWCEEALKKVSVVKSPKTKTVENQESKDVTSRAVKGRIDTLVRCLKHIASLPALNKWKPAFDLGVAHLKSQKNMAAKGKMKKNSYLPLTLKEIDDTLSSCESFGTALLVLTYLSLGTRSGDAEKARFEHLQGDKFRLDLVQSKTKTSNTPVAPLVLRATLRYMHEVGVHFDSVPTGVDKRRFRPTCAVGLCLSRLSPLEVSSRTGHATQMMVIRHYGKTFPADFNHKNFRAYAGTQLIRVDGVTVSESESDYDAFLLRLLLEQAVRFGVKEDVKKWTLAEFEPQSETVGEVVEF